MATHEIKYGRDGLRFELPDSLNVTTITPTFVEGVTDQQNALREALQDPIACEPLSEIAEPDDTVAIVFSDITRPAPNHLMIPAILEELDQVPPEQFVLCNALGTHRRNSEEELIELLGEDIVENYRIIQNNCTDQSTQTYLGESSYGHEQWINEEYVEADVKILTGFIEPHFFAGFSGGGKAVMPGMAGQDTVLGNHDARMIGDENATWGVSYGNPIWEEAREIALRTDPDFLLNVALNNKNRITGVFAGDLEEAHDEGIEFVRENAMTPVEKPFDIVITNNSGYPLDMNLYQCGKGMSAAEMIVREGGDIIMAAECSDGIPDHGLYGQMVNEADSPDELEKNVVQSEETRQDQWAGQIQARIQNKADVYLYSDGLSNQQIEDALLTPVRDISDLVQKLVSQQTGDPDIAILTEGPQTIPYVEDEDTTESS